MDLWFIFISMERYSYFEPNCWCAIYIICKNSTFTMVTFINSINLAKSLISNPVIIHFAISIHKLSNIFNTYSSSRYLFPSLTWKGIHRNPWNQMTEFRKWDEKKSPEASCSQLRSINQIQVFELDCLSRWSIKAPIPNNSGTVKQKIQS